MVTIDSGTLASLPHSDGLPLTQALWLVYHILMVTIDSGTLASLPHSDGLPLQYSGTLASLPHTCTDGYH